MTEIGGFADESVPQGWHPRYVIQKAPGIGGNPIPEDEPCIVVRAQDRLALSVIDYYLAAYRGLHGTLGLGDTAETVLAELEERRQAIVKWQRDHPTKYADR